MFIISGLACFLNKPNVYMNVEVPDHIINVNRPENDTITKSSLPEAPKVEEMSNIQ